MSILNSERAAKWPNSPAAQEYLARNPNGTLEGHLKECDDFWDNWEREMKNQVCEFACDLAENETMMCNKCRERIRVGLLARLPEEQRKWNRLCGTYPILLEAPSHQKSISSNLSCLDYNAPDYWCPSELGRFVASLTRNEYVEPIMSALGPHIANVAVAVIDRCVEKAVRKALAEGNQQNA